MTLEELSHALHRQFGPDAAQHALMRIVEKGWHLNPGTHLVDRFAKVVAMNFNRTRRASGSGSSREVLAILPDDPDLNRLQREEASQLGRVEALESLSRLNREAILVGLGYSHKEVAEILQEPVGTVKSRAFRSRRNRK